MARQEHIGADEQEVMRSIVQEVDAARDAFELVRSFAPVLPIRSFDDVLGALGEGGTLTFRGQQFNVRAFEHLIPDAVFPIESLQKLVALAAVAVELIPGVVGSELADPESARRRMRRASLLSLAPSGRLDASLGGQGFQPEPAGWSSKIGMSNLETTQLREREEGI